MIPANKASITVGGKLIHLNGLVGTKDLTPFQSSFVDRMWKITNGAKQTSGLSERQLDFIDELFEKHFAA